MKCRFCRAVVTQVFVDLGMSPMANSYLSADEINHVEPFYPLRTFVCSKCLLVQLEEFETPEHIFTNYAYYSSYFSRRIIPQLRHDCVCVCVCVCLHLRVFLSPAYLECTDPRFAFAFYFIANEILSAFAHE